MEKTHRNTLEQGRALHAYNAAQKGIKDFKKDYLSFVNDMPMLIKTNGLGAAIAFATYKNKASMLVYEQLKDWLTEKDPKGLIELKANERLSGKLTEINSTEYKAVTIEVMAWLNWLRKFAKGIEKEREG